jgi:cyclopropane fatty-acyl-phospholipid synthase-like methyltransferase
VKRKLIARWRFRVRRRFPSREARRHALVGPPEFWRKTRAFQIAFLKRQGLRPDHTLVDIGCGTLRGGVPIIEYLDRGNYAGVDVRQEIESEARAELAEHRLDEKAPTLAYGRRLAEVHLGRQFDFAWAFAVLFHLTDEHLAECFTFVGEHLAPSGVFYANVNLGHNEPDTWREFPELWRTREQYEQAAGAVGLSVSDLGELGSLGHDFAGQAQHMLEFRFRS